MTKPFTGLAGCCHFHISLWDKSDHNLCVDTNDPLGLSSTSKSFIQGILDHAPVTMLLANPIPNCYRRLKPHIFAPSNIS